MIDVLIFLCGVGAGMCAALAIAASGKEDHIQDAYDQGKMDGFYEGMTYRKDAIDEVKRDE